MKRGFLFNSVPTPKVGRNSFDLSHELKMSCGLGRLVPLFYYEQLPGDYHRITPSSLIRTQALISPLMHRIDVSVNAFQVPLRLLWDSFEDFITGGEDGLQAPEKPYFTLFDLAKAVGDNSGDVSERVAELVFGPSSLLCYVGVPPKVDFNSAGIPYFDVQSYTGWSESSHPVWADEHIDLLPFRAYYKIYYEMFRDQNVMDMPKPVTSSGRATYAELRTLFYTGNLTDSDPVLGQPYQRCWRKDYFTSALPSAQRGPEAVLSLTGSAPVSGSLQDPTVESRANWTTLVGNRPVTISRSSGNVGSAQLYQGEEAQPSQSISQILRDPSVIGTADLSNVSPIGIIALRNAFKLQQFLERNNIAGGRYIESILAHFGVKSPDRRLQRPAYLGGISQPITISEIETNASGSGEYDNVVGDLAGKGKMFGKLGTYSAFATEHCFVVGLISIMPIASYGQGLDRMFTRFDKFDYAWPEFQNIGEQAIKNKELYLFQSQPNGDFGYTPRYAEYKYKADRFAGDFLTSLAFWHMGRIFAAPPTLSSKFLLADPTDRVFAVADTASSQHILVDSWISCKSARPFQKFGLPGIS